MASQEEIQAFIIGRLRERSAKARNATYAADTNLIDSGIVDSFAFLELISEVEKHFSLEFDLSNHDFDEISVLGPLCTAIATGK